VSRADFVGPIGNASEKYSGGSPLTRLLLRRFLDQLDLAVLAIQPETLLDVGCGEGVVTDRLAALLPTATVLGVDADDSVLRSHWERRTRDRLRFESGSGYALRFADGAYDVVCAIEVLEHVERPGEMLEEMARVARQSLIVSVPREPLWRLSHLLAGRNLRSLGDTPGHINHWSSKSFSRLVCHYGVIKHLSRPFPWTLAVLDVRS